MVLSSQKPSRYRKAAGLSRQLLSGSKEIYKVQAQEGIKKSGADSSEKRKQAKERVLDYHSWDFSLYGKSKRGESEKKDIHLGVKGQRFSNMAVDREAHKCQKEDIPSQNPERTEKKWLKINQRETAAEESDFRIINLILWVGGINKNK